MSIADGIHLMAKPIGPVCNLDCGYCFYLEKEQYYPDRHSFRMDWPTLEAYVRRYIEAQNTPEVEFTWQGGEPTLMGLGFFEAAVSLQKRFAAGKTIKNTLQTNGTLLDEAWAEFLKRENFLVGLSIDGPREIHDAGRPDKQGRGSFGKAFNGLQLLAKHRVPFNVLTTVSDAVSRHPLQVYRFLKSQGVRHIQFNPVVERKGDALTKESVGAEAYGDFLIAIFDEWVRNDVGEVHVMNFEWALASWCQLPASVCLFAPKCGKAAIVEHDGDVYSCDHFMFPEYKLGNIHQDAVASLMQSEQQAAFGAAKQDSLPAYCKRCPYLFACNGECPKNRFATTPDGEAGLNYLCPSYKKYFAHITQYMNAMGQLVSRGQPASLIMDAFKGPLAVVGSAQQP